MKLRILYILFLFVSVPLTGQDNFTDVESRLDTLFAHLFKVRNDSARLQVNDSICGFIEEYAGSEDIFNHSFRSLRYLGQVTSPDSLLKIISWNVNLENYKGKYFSYLILKSGAGKKNKVTPLRASYSNKPATEDTTYTGKDWYGALYYGIKPVTSNKEKCWVVLGLDYGNPLITRKLIDVISFDDNGLVVFGKKWFETTRGMKFRKIFSYASTGMMTLRFESDTSIVFDHLVPVAAENNQVFYGADYSYDSFIFNDGIWKFRLNVDARNYEQK